MDYGKCMRNVNCKTCYDYNKCGQVEDNIKKPQKKKKRNKGKRKYDRSREALH